MPLLSNDQLLAIATIASDLFSQSRFDDAAVLYRGLVALGDNAYGDAGLGAIALAADPPDLETAFTHLSRAAALNGRDATLHANLGEVLLRQGQLEAAATEFCRAFELDPHESDAGANRARTIIQANRRLADAIKRRQKP